MKKAILFGLRKVDKEKYKGWDGDCPGTLIDVAVMREMLIDRFDEIEYHNSTTANKHWFEFEIKSCVNYIESGDTLLIYFSGHGGQAIDHGDDEIDGLDETICLYDGEMSDDKINDLLQLFPEDINLVVITDCCNSGTNLDLLKKPIPCKNVIHIAGCSDGAYSYGNILDGGNLTRSLAQTFHNHNIATWKQLFEVAKTEMSEHQVPIINFKGDLINKEAF